MKKFELTLEINGEPARASLEMMQKEAARLRNGLKKATDPAEAEKYATKLRGLNKQMSDIWKSTRAVTEQTKKWQRVTELLSVAGIVTGIDAVFSTISNLNQEALDLYTAQTLADEQLKQSIINTNGAVKKSFEEIKAEAEAFSFVSTFNVEEIEAIQYRLVNFTNITEDTFTRATQTILDYSTKFEEDFDEVTTKIGEALNKPLDGLEAFEDRGVVFTAKQKKLIKSFVKTGETAKAQAVILDQLAKSTKGAAKIAADADGGWGKFRKTINGHKKELGALVAQGRNALLPYLERLVQVIVTVVKSFAQVPEFIRENKTSLIALAVAIASMNAHLIKAHALTLADIAVRKAQILWTNRSALSFRKLNLIMKSNPIGFVVSLVAGLVIAFDQLYQRSEKVRGGVAGLGAVAKEVFTIIQESVQKFIDGWNELKDGNIKSALKKFGEGINKSNPITLAFTEGERLKKAFTKGYTEKLAEEAKAKIQGAMNLDLPDAGKEIGEQIGSNIADSIEDGIKKKTKKKEVREKLTTAPKLQSIQPQEVVNTADARLNDLERRTDFGLLDEEKKFLKKLYTEEEYHERRLQLLISAKERELQILADYGQKETLNYAEQETEKLRLQQELESQRVENKQRTHEIEMMLQKQAFDSLHELFSSGINLLAKDEKARRKHASAIKAFEIARIAVNLQAEISEIWKNIGSKPLGRVIAVAKTIAAGVRAGAATSRIRKAKFYEGGYTGKTSPLPPDETGARPIPRTSIIDYHVDEYVNPSWQLRHPWSRKLINALDFHRRTKQVPVLKSFYNGGFTAKVPSVTTPVTQSTQVNQSQDFTNFLNQFTHALRNIKATVSLNDINNSQDYLQTIQDRASV